MLKTNTSYFTGSQLNNRFFLYSYHPQKYTFTWLHTDGFSLLSFNHVTSTDCMHHPHSEATTGILINVLEEHFRWDFGNKLCISVIYPSRSRHVCSQILDDGVPQSPHYSLSLMYSIYSGMLKHTQYKKIRME